MKTLKALFLLLSAMSLVILASAQTDIVSPFDTTMYGKNDKVGRYAVIRGFNMYYETYGTGERIEEYN